MTKSNNHTYLKNWVKNNVKNPTEITDISSFSKETDTLGFPESETWNLDSVMIDTLAERVIYFGENHIKTPEQIAAINLGNTQIPQLTETIKAQEQKLAKQHKHLLDLFKDYYNEETTSPETKKAIWQLWAEIQGNYWS